MAWLEIVDARKHNLKNVHLRIPKKKLVVISGVSGSGKSSLAFDTIFQEGQRRYLESLSTYARQYIKSLERPDVQSIHGISPTISIDQKHAAYHYNSTVGTISEIAPFLRLLFARVGQARCPECGREIRRFSRAQMVEDLFGRFPGRLLHLYAVVIRNRRGHYQALFDKYRKRGFLKALCDGVTCDLENAPLLDRHLRHTIAVLVDVVEARESERGRIVESVNLALNEGSGELLIKLEDGSERFVSERLHCDECGISLKEPQPGTFSFNSPEGACPACQGDGRLETGICLECRGSGLNREALAFRFLGHTIHELGEMEVADLAARLAGYAPEPREREVVRPLLPQIRQRLETLVSLNLGYITLNRRLQTLSGGELQRARLVSQIGFSLNGIIYILDEPSIGMHPSEQRNLIRLLQDLRDKGNSVLVVEHDEATIRAADFVVDVGPGPGERGGEIVFAGPRPELRRCRGSLTADYLYGRRGRGLDKSYRWDRRSWLELENVSINNLRGVDLCLPLGALTVVTGVSGSGKSSLIVDALYPLLKRALEGEGDLPAGLEARGLKVPETLKRVLLVSQAAIGKNSRSCPATYVDIMPMIRDLFSGLPEAKVRGYAAGRFSFNVRGGRCEACEGLGVQKLQMSFLPQLEVDCPVCNGRRYNSETLKVHYRGHSIADVLDLTAVEARQLFSPIAWLASRLQILDDVGLGYLRLGQSSTTLSGGESQRIKLTRELARIAARPTLYILDEPTVGLHFEDIRNLLRVFDSLIANGHTVVVIEHNLDVVRAADQVIDLGPGGGRHGGRILYAGDPGGLAERADLQTGLFLRGETPDALS